MSAPIMRASSEARRRRVAVAGLLAAVIGAAVAFTAAQAMATAGSGAVSTYTARGPVSQEVVIGVPKSATATKVVTVRVKGKVVKRKVSFTYQTVTPMMRCGTSTACDTAYQQLTIPPGGYTGWHTHPGPTFVAVAQGEGTLYPRDVGLPVVQVRGRGRLHAALDRGAQHEERGLDAAGLVGVLCTSSGDGERGDPH